MTIWNSYPIPKIKDEIVKMTKFKLFATIDIMSAYYHIMVEPESRKYLTFIHDKRKYQWKRMPFGPKNAPAVFAEAMQKIFWKELKEGWFSQYFDDLTIGGNSIEDLKGKLEKIFQK